VDVEDLRARGAELTLRLADTAELLAEQADLLADHLEQAADRGDRERRLELAAWERQVADVERRNAGRLRNGQRDFEHLPDRPTPPAAGDVGGHAFGDTG